MNTKKAVNLAVLLSMAIVVAIIERMLPQLPVPGAKLGLANIITLITLYLYGKKDAFTITLLRIFLVALLSGTLGMPSFWLSLSGGLLAFSFMVMTKQFKVFSIISVSVMGSLGHSLGQVLMAIFLINIVEFIYYFPLLFLISVPTGLFTGLVAQKFTQILNHSKTIY